MLTNPWKFVTCSSKDEELNIAAEKLTSAGYEIVQILPIHQGNIYSYADDVRADGVNARIIRDINGYLSTNVILVGWNKNVGDCSLVPGKLSPVMTVPPLDIS